jgi:hypothetical protein
MARQRSMIAGMTDYTGVPLDDILQHMRAWRENLTGDVVALGHMAARLQALPDGPEKGGGRDHARYFSDLLGRYIADFDRLIAELPAGVRPRHVEMVGQLFESSRQAEDSCVLFKQRYRLDMRGDEDPAVAICSEIYVRTREAVIDLLDLSNVLLRLQTYVGEPAIVSPSAPISDALELKPNVFGLGINLNYIIGKFIRRKPSK